MNVLSSDDMQDIKSAQEFHYALCSVYRDFR